MMGFIFQHNGSHMGDELISDPLGCTWCRDAVSIRSIGTEVCSGLSTPPWGQQRFVRGTWSSGPRFDVKRWSFIKAKHIVEFSEWLFFSPIHDLPDINLVPLSQYCSIMFDTFSRSDKTWVACSICGQVEEQWHKTQIISQDVWTYFPRTWTHFVW